MKNDDVSELNLIKATFFRQDFFFKYTNVITSNIYIFTQNKY